MWNYVLPVISLVPLISELHALYGSWSTIEPKTDPLFEKDTANL